jgi:DnaD/phage-associated family protein
MSATQRAAPAFSGFPDGRLRATVLPTMFITELVGAIENLAELKLALYLFWRFGQRRTIPSFLTRGEIEADPVIKTGLGEEVQIDRTIERVVERRLILRRSMELRGRIEECYFLNTASGRRAVRDLESGRIDLGQVVVPEPTERAGRPNIYQLYEQNVGLLTPLIVEELSEAERRYAGDWIEEAFRQAVAYNRRNWKYIRRILERWANEGKEPETGGERAARDRSRRPDGTGR